MAEKQRSETGQFVSTLPLRAVYIDRLITPKRYKNKKTGKEEGEPKFGCTLLASPDLDVLKAMKVAVLAVAQEKWPGIQAKDIQAPFKSGDKVADKAKTADKDPKAWARGFVTMAVSSVHQPRLSVLDKGGIIDLKEPEQIALYKKHFYNGVDVFVELNFVPYESDLGGMEIKGVTAYINQCVVTGKGGKIELGTRSAADTFGSYVGAYTNVDPYAGADASDDFQ